MTQKCLKTVREMRLPTNRSDQTLHRLFQKESDSKKHSKLRLKKETEKHRIVTLHSLQELFSAIFKRNAREQSHFKDLKLPVQKERL